MGFRVYALLSVFSSFLLVCPLFDLARTSSMNFGSCSQDSNDVINMTVLSSTVEFSLETSLFLLRGFIFVSMFMISVDFLALVASQNQQNYTDT